MMEWLQKIRGTKGLPLLITLAALGVFLFALSYMLPKEEAPKEGAVYTASSLEARLSGVLSQIEGVGEVQVLIHVAEDGQVVGVIVVAQGAQDLLVRTELMRAAMTALDIPARSVEVFAMQKEGE